MGRRRARKTRERNDREPRLISVLELESKDPRRHEMGMQTKNQTPSTAKDGRNPAFCAARIRQKNKGRGEVGYGILMERTPCRIGNISRG